MYMRGFAEVAAPLRHLQQKNAVWQWGEAQEQAFLLVKLALSQEVVLQHPAWDKQFFVQTDACDYGMGAVLVQCDEEGVERPVAYWSKAFSPAEKNYSTTEQEALAVVSAIKHWRVFVAGSHFVVQTDHAALKYIFTTKNSTGRLSRWAMRLQEYDFEVQHRPGITHVVPDALSRYPLTIRIPEGEESSRHHDAQCIAALGGEGTVGRQGVINQRVAHPAEMSELQQKAEADMGLEAVATVVFGLSNRSDIFDRLQAEQMNDEQLAPIIRCLEGLEQTMDESTANKLEQQAKQYVLREGILHLRREAVGDDQSPLPPGVVRGRAIDRMVIPVAMQRDLLILFHEDPGIGAHMGRVPMLNKLSARYYWRGMGQAVQEYCQSCWTCCTGKAYRQHAKRVDRGRGIPCDPFGEVCVDISGPFHETAQGNRFVCVFMCMFTGWAEAVPLPDISSKTVHRAFLSEWVRRYGCPRVLVSDRGSQFTARR